MKPIDTPVDGKAMASIGCVYGQDGTIIVVVFSLFSPIQPIRNDDDVFVINFLNRKLLGVRREFPSSFQFFIKAVREKATTEACIRLVSLDRSWYINRRSGDIGTHNFRFLESQ